MSVTVKAGSHIPVLVKIMGVIDKPVVELGMGWNSTPLLHWLCKEKGLYLSSFESDPDWIKLFVDFAEAGHNIEFIDFVERKPHFAGKADFGLVFVDHRPARKRRESVRYFADKSDYIVLHDSELSDDPAYKYTPLYQEFKYVYEYTKSGQPHTVILSNKKDLSWLMN